MSTPAITRSPAVHDLARAADEYQAVFQSLKSWGKDVQLIESHFHGTHGIFFLEFHDLPDTADPRSTLMRIYQSLNDKGYDVKHSYGCTCCNRVVTLEVNLPREQVVTNSGLRTRSAAEIGANQVPT